MSTKKLVLILLLFIGWAIVCFALVSLGGAINTWQWWTTFFGIQIIAIAKHKIMEEN